MLQPRKLTSRGFRPSPKQEKSYQMPKATEAFRNPGRVSGEVVSLRKAEKLKGGQDEQRHKERLAQIGCMACLRTQGNHIPGPVELHHLRTGGWGKGNYRTLIPLCFFHHRGDMGVHGLGTKGFERHYGFTQQDLLNDALALIGEKT